MNKKPITAEEFYESKTLAEKQALGWIDFDRNPKTDWFKIMQAYSDYVNEEQAKEMIAKENYHNNEMLEKMEENKALECQVETLEESRDEIYTNKYIADLEMYIDELEEGNKALRDKIKEWYNTLNDCDDIFTGAVEVMNEMEQLLK